MLLHNPGPINIQLYQSYLSSFIASLIVLITVAMLQFCLFIEVQKVLEEDLHTIQQHYINLQALCDPPHSTHFCCIPIVKIGII